MENGLIHYAENVCENWMQKDIDFNNINEKFIFAPAFENEQT